MSSEEKPTNRLSSPERNEFSSFIEKTDKWLNFPWYEIDAQRRKIAQILNINLPFIVFLTFLATLNIQVNFEKPIAKDHQMHPPPQKTLTLKTNNFTKIENLQNDLETVAKSFYGILPIQDQVRMKTYLVNYKLPPLLQEKEKAIQEYLGSYFSFKGFSKALGTGESNSNNGAVSQTGAVGLKQVMPITAEEHLEDFIGYIDSQTLKKLQNNQALKASIHELKLQELLPELNSMLKNKASFKKAMLTLKKSKNQWQGEEDKTGAIFLINEIFNIVFTEILKIPFYNLLISDLEIAEIATMIEAKIDSANPFRDILVGYSAGKNSLLAVYKIFEAIQNGEDKVGDKYQDLQSLKKEMEKIDPQMLESMHNKTFFFILAKKISEKKADQGINHYIRIMSLYYKQLIEKNPVLSDQLLAEIKDFNQFAGEYMSQSKDLQIAILGENESQKILVATKYKESKMEK